MRNIRTMAAAAAFMLSLAPVAAVSQPLNTWSGFYVGAHAGGAWSTNDWTFFNGFDPEVLHQSTSSWIAGGQIGALFQVSPHFVFGAEASWSGTDLNNDSPSSVSDDRARQSKMTDMILATARLGYASGSWLSYIKGGYANAKLDFSSSVQSTGEQTTTSSGRDGGWTIGAGVEYRVTRAISVGLEYNYVHINIDGRNQKVADGFAMPETVNDASASGSSVWARVNVRLSSLFR